MGQINFLNPPPPLPAQLMYPNLVAVSFMIYISISFEKKIIKTRGLFHVWLGLYANLSVAFFSFVFVSFGMWAYLDFGDSGFWGFDWFIFVSDHFL